MSILDKFQVSNTMERRIRMPRFKVNVSEEEVPSTQDQSQYQTRFRLTATLGVEFYANEAQRERAKRDARRILIHELYGDMLAHLAEFRLLADEEDFRGIIEKTFEIEKGLLDAD